MIDDQLLQRAQTGYQRYVQLVQQLGHEQTQALDRMIEQLEESKIATIHQTIEQL